MPLFTKTTARIKNSFSQGMPKNLKEYGEKVNEKFLDNHLGAVEDFSLKYPNNELTQWFKDYQNRYFNSVLLKDSFLKIDEDVNFGTIRNYRPMSIQNVGFLGGLTSPNGAELTSGIDQINNGTAGSEIQASKASSLGIIGKLYDQIALKVTTSSGNIHLGVYDDSSAPNVLLADSGSIACPASSSYTYQSVTEFSLTTTQTWLAWSADNTTITVRTANNTDTNARKVHNMAYGALSNPFGSIAFTDNYSNVMKTGHS